MRKSVGGFTIVELLIVIVVIGILAAITIVAYSNVRERSANTVTKTGTKEYIKALRMYAIDNNAYPTMRACLGEGYEYNGEVNRCGGNAGIYTNSTFDSQLQEYFGGHKPKLTTTNIRIRTADTRAGGYFDPFVGTYGVVYYILSGTTDTCLPGDSKALSGDADITGFFCTHYLPNPN